jgi:hypothetical protein
MAQAERTVILIVILIFLIEVYSLQILWAGFTDLVKKANRQV